MEGCPRRNQVKMMDTEGLQYVFHISTRKRRCFGQIHVQVDRNSWLDQSKWRLTDSCEFHKLVRLGWNYTENPEWNSAGRIHVARHTEAVGVINLTCTAFFCSYCKALKLDSSDSRVLHTHDNSANFTTAIRTAHRIKHLQVIHW